MTRYTKDGDKYLVSGDGGEYELSPKWVGIHLKFSKVSRSSTAGFDTILHKDKGIEFKRSITAVWEPHVGTIEVFDESQCTRTNARKVAYIRVGDFKESHIYHFEAIEEHPEAISLNLFISQEWFDWLWSELGSRKEAVLGGRVHIMPWLAGIEASCWYDTSYRPIRVERGGTIEVLDAEFGVGDVVAEEEEVAESAPATFSEKLERELETTNQGVLLKRIFWMLAVIAVFLFFKLS